jgi:hypothetical protein
LNLRFIGIAGKPYYIQGSPTLTIPDWQNIPVEVLGATVFNPDPLLPGSVIAEPSGFVNVKDPEAATFPNRFYRMVIVPTVPGP